MMYQGGSVDIIEQVEDEESLDRKWVKGVVCFIWFGSDLVGSGRC